jgi:predicted adenylyl cyclase CyaB
MKQESPRQNIEIKARAGDPAALLATALALPARDAGVLRQVDTYFNVPRGRLKLREVRGEPGELIYYDRPDQGEAKRSDYWIAPITEATEVGELLEVALGVRVRVSKERRLLLYRHTRIHLDTVAGLGAFVELETVLESLSEEDGRAESREVMEALGIREEDLLESSYSDMVVFFPTSVPIF